jgi:hypothetical protein
MDQVILVRMVAKQRRYLLPAMVVLVDYVSRCTNSKYRH